MVSDVRSPGGGLYTSVNGGAVSTLDDLPDAFGTTREALRTLACYAISPARKAVTGHIDLRAAEEGFGTPPFDDGSRILVHADRIARSPGGSVPITTVRAAAEFLAVSLSADPGVGRDLPPFAPDEALAVDATASLALGRWYAFASGVLTELAAKHRAGTTWTQQKLWPEHFDLALEVGLPNGRRTNVGFSPGDSTSAAPYVYVGPHDLTGIQGVYWNASFGASLPYKELVGTGAPDVIATEFISTGLRLLADA